LYNGTHHSVPECVRSAGTLLLYWSSLLKVLQHLAENSYLPSLARTIERQATI
jgi:hypothetical protein